LTGAGFQTNVELGNNPPPLNVRKPIGWTSNDVVRRAKRMLRGAKVGHAGALDPFADGVLLLCIGRAGTRQVPRLMELEKEYRLVLELGIETDTLDVSGVIKEQRQWAASSREQVMRILPNFIGEIEQAPPAFSAIHVDGKRAYDLARNGATFAMKKRRVIIYGIDFVELTENRLTLNVVCSKGVYVRSLAWDIAQALGEIGYLKKLTRTRIGPYHLQDAVSVTEFAKLLIG
jgi:tRNA pseudouridine55 synthase